MFLLIKQIFCDVSVWVRGLFYGSAGTVGVEDRGRKVGKGFFRGLKNLAGFGSDVSIRENLETALEQRGPSRLMLLNVLGFRRLRVEDVMVPRADIVAVDERIRLDDLLTLFGKAGHSRIPTYRDTLDDPTGMVHIKDMMAYITRTACLDKDSDLSLDLQQVDLSSRLSSTYLVRRVLFVPPSMFAVDLFVQMQANRTHLVVVVDEYGGTEGLLSIEDLVEEIVGEIEDEHDTNTPLQIVYEKDGSYVADARASIEDLRRLIGTNINLSIVEEEVETLGGLIFSLSGRVPACGEFVICEEGGLTFEILDADLRRVKVLRIHCHRKED
ncbi:MAG: hemolysin family protein [Alphaproteobacteria bacterium]|nr:hemolysin family protein [Alphaproteobacteria bacterium]